MLKIRRILSKHVEPASSVAPMWGNAIDDYLTGLKAAGRPETTLQLRYSQLTYMGRCVHTPLQEVTDRDLVEWFAAQDWARETRRSYRAAARGFFAWTYRNGHTAIDPAADLPPIKADAPAPKPTPDRVWNEARMAADPRIALMLRLAAEAGLRRAEVAKVHTRDLEYAPNGPQLLVHGKGSKERHVPITVELAGLITQAPWGWLFPNGRGDHLTPGWVGTICARVLPDVWTMHSLRHRFATRAYQGTHNLRAVQTLLGHSSVATTERYTLVEDGALRAAVLAAASGDVIACLAAVLVAVLFATVLDAVA